MTDTAGSPWTLDSKDFVAASPGISCRAARRPRQSQVNIGLAGVIHGFTKISEGAYIKVLAVGANGKTGRMVVQYATAAGHKVTAFVRHSSQSEASKAKLAQGDATSRVDVDAAMQGQAAVIDAIGSKTTYKDTDVESSAAATIIASMTASGVRRLIATSMFGVGNSKGNTPFYAGWLVSTVLRGTDKDKSAMEARITASGLGWTILRPAILSDSKATGSVQVFLTGTGKKAHKITLGDVANFMVKQLSDTNYLQQSMVIANS